mmetsp:Transcript_27311/g.62922  ORF Transcript_27311/g.62922 Transcript_27311/m.62922 type:complete len:208 (+) Transcript_27311:637-1260(+)
MLMAPLAKDQLDRGQDLHRHPFSVGVVLVRAAIGQANHHHALALSLCPSGQVRLPRRPHHLTGHRNNSLNLHGLLQNHRRCPRTLSQRARHRCTLQSTLLHHNHILPHRPQCLTHQCLSGCHRTTTMVSSLSSTHHHRRRHRRLPRCIPQSHPPPHRHKRHHRGAPKQSRPQFHPSPPTLQPPRRARRMRHSGSPRIHLTLGGRCKE